MQDDLFAHLLPTPRGATFVEARDGARLAEQGRRVLAYMLRMDCECTLAEIAKGTGDPEASISARLRDIRAAGFNVDSRHLRGGQWVYRVSRKSPVA